MNSPVKVVFLAGAGRSGSTLLAEILGKSNQLVCVGELEKLPSYGLKKNDPCTCGKSFRDCKFWQDVIEALHGEEDLTALPKYRSMLRLRDLPHLWSGFVLSKQRAQSLELLAHTWSRLLRAISTVSQAEWVVDSSKAPTLLHLLAKDERFEFRVVHLVRDSRAVAYSYARQKYTPTAGGGSRRITAKGPARAALAWLRWNLLVELARMRGISILRLRYEDLANSPRESLEQISHFVGQPLDLSWTEAAHFKLSQSHSIGGNPTRFQRQDVRLRLDDEWQIRMSTTAKTLVTALTFPLLFSYGYL